MVTKLVSCIIVTGCGTLVVPVFLGIRLVAYGHLVSLSLLPRIINNPSSSHQPTHPLAVLLSPVKSSVSSSREVRTVNASLWTTSDDDSRRYQHAATGTSEQAGHSHTPNERGQSVPRQYYRLVLARGFAASDGPRGGGMEGPTIYTGSPAIFLAVMEWRSMAGTP